MLLPSEQRHLRKNFVPFAVKSIHVCDGSKSSTSGDDEFLQISRFLWGFRCCFFFAVGLGRYEVAVATVGMLIKHSLLGHLPFSSMMFPYFPWNVPFKKGICLCQLTLRMGKKGSTSAIDSIGYGWSQGFQGMIHHRGKSTKGLWLCTM